LRIASASALRGVGLRLRVRGVAILDERGQVGLDRRHGLMDLAAVVSTQHDIERRLPSAVVQVEEVVPVFRGHLLILTRCRRIGRAVAAWWPPGGVRVSLLH
jgi:hypothetical protein